MSSTICGLIDKIEMYVTKRQIGIAEHLAGEFHNECSTSPLQESGYAILSIVLSYFEMIEEFSTGQSSERASADFFIRGFKKVYPATPLTDTQIRNSIYKLVRCGMYHDGMTKSQTRLSRHFVEGFAVIGSEVHVNPAKVVEEIKGHFARYVGRLRNPADAAQIAEQASFHNWCQNIGADLTTPTPASTKTTAAPWEQG